MGQIGQITWGSDSIHRAMGPACSVVSISPSTLLEAERAQNIHAFCKKSPYFVGAGVWFVADGESVFIMSSGRAGSESSAEMGTAAGGGFGGASGTIGTGAGKVAGGGAGTLGVDIAGVSTIGSGGFLRNSRRL